MEEARKREAHQRVEEAKDKVRALAAAVDPPPVLLAAQVHELARMAARANHPDSNILISLSREIDRFNDKIDISFTCLKVWGGGRDGDIVGAVVAKQLKAAIKKEASSDKKEKQKEGKIEDRPVMLIDSSQFLNCHTMTVHDFTSQTDCENQLFQLWAGQCNIHGVICYIYMCSSIHNVDST